MEKKNQNFELCQIKSFEWGFNRIKNFANEHDETKIVNCHKVKIHRKRKSTVFEW